LYFEHLGPPVVDIVHKTLSHPHLSDREYDC
jgi:hypothetical protein